MKVDVLDFGYVELIETWGSDERIIEAARMSTGKGFKGWGTPGTPGDEKLLRYLWDNAHATPFEMAGAVFEVKAPIFVFREWHRHRTQSYNEMSARYTPIPDENYIPFLNRLFALKDRNKQAGTAVGSAELTESAARAWLADLEGLYAHAERVYQQGLAVGVPKELARLPMPVGRYSRMRASANLRNWLAFLDLRAAPEAQWEIQQYAYAVRGMLAGRFPRTLALASEAKVERTQ